MIKYIDTAQLQDKTVLLRVDFNVPLDKAGNITDDRRIREALPTIQHCLDKGAAVVLMSHFGRPEGNGPEAKYSLKQVHDHLSALLGRSVFFVNDCVGESAYSVTGNLHAGDVALLENVRFYKAENKGDKDFAQKLARHGNVYVNDAFGSAHRAHASVSIVAQFFQEKYAGFLIRREKENADRVLQGAKQPYTAIVGGAKVSDKILIIENLLDKVDNLIIGGGMAYTFLKAQGKQVGKSLVEEDKLQLSLDIIAQARAKGVNLLLPVDSVAADKFAADAADRMVSNENIPADWMGLDIGPVSIENFKQVILKSATILWNGPMGVFEFDKFAQGTLEIGRAVAAATDKGAFSLVGGGDSAAAIEKAQLDGRISYVSTGGGALLEYLEGKTLPGIAALEG